MQSKQIEDIVEFAVVTISNYCTTSTTKENINKDRFDCEHTEFRERLYY